MPENEPEKYKATLFSPSGLIHQTHFPINKQEVSSITYVGKNWGTFKDLNIFLVRNVESVVYIYFQDMRINEK